MAKEYTIKITDKQIDAIMYHMPLAKISELLQILIDVNIDAYIASIERINNYDNSNNNNNVNSSGNHNNDMEINRGKPDKKK